MKKTEHLVKTIARNKLCVICKGEKLLCGKTSCPLLLRFYKLVHVSKTLQPQFIGSSPPSIFIGRENYPKVNVGPLLPPYLGDTSKLDFPELWQGITMPEFVQMRSSLVRGMKRLEVTDIESTLALQLQEMVLSERSVDSEVKFFKNPVSSIVMDDEVQPFGPSGRIEKFMIGNIKTNQKLEKAYYDTDLLAQSAIMDLYKNQTPISVIQRVLSAGMLGVKKRRRFVPTRWSITAVDSTLSSTMLDKIKSFETIDKIRVYESNMMENRFIVILLPQAWSYELVEAWYPGTIWNPASNEIFMISDHEYYNGRTEYAQIGGCYYASRFAIAEKLIQDGKQASAIVLREAQPSYIMPVGVWNVRENVRNALAEKPAEFEDFKSVLGHLKMRFHIPFKDWLKESEMLKYHLYQRRVEDFEVR